MIEIIKQKLVEGLDLADLLNNLKDDAEYEKWSDNFLYDSLPFNMEIHQLKRGKIYKSEPKNKSYKTNNYFNSENKIIAAFSYIPNWEEPSEYLFVEIENDSKFIYRFDIEKKLTNVFLHTYKDNCLTSACGVNKNGAFTLVSILQNMNISINLETGVNVENIENKSNSKIEVSILEQNNIQIIRKDSTNDSYLVYSGINPYIGLPYANPMVL